MKKISIFIRTHNEAKWLGKTLRQVMAQHMKADEVVVLDNDSSDETCAIASSFGAVVKNIPQKEFTYGRALNRSLLYTTGDIIVFLSAHSPPVNRFWLKNLVRPILISEASVSFGRQIPMPGVNVFEEWNIYRAFPKQPGPIKKILHFQNINFSNANAAVSSSFLKTMPFSEEISFAEDLEWAHRVVKAGQHIQYCPDAVVYHSHELDINRLTDRTVNIGKAMRQQGMGEIYQNPLVFKSIFCATIIVDLVYCCFRGYWKKIPEITKYRTAFLKGLKQGLNRDENE
ncbi:MAG: glycosyltransferase [Thermodesulfobacteriota bacterium]|nr:glycosyltransferase [Thermodesulfobacteriota bacterium]